MIGTNEIVIEGGGGAGGIEEIEGNEPFLYTPHSVYTSSDSPPQYSIWNSASATITPTPQCQTRTDRSSGFTALESRFYTMYVNEVDGDGDTILRSLSEMYYQSPKLTFDNPAAVGVQELNDFFLVEYKIFLITETFDPTTLTFSSVDALDKEMIRFSMFRFLEDKRTAEEVNYFFSMDGPANTNFATENTYGILTSFSSSMRVTYSQHLSMTADTASNQIWGYP